MNKITRPLTRITISGFLSSKTITRDGNTYTINFSNYDFYGNPKLVSEAGDRNRTAEISYWYNTSKHIVQGKPLSETVTGDFPGSFTTSYTYDSNGRPTQVNKYGVITIIVMAISILRLMEMETLFTINGQMEISQR